MKKLVLWLGVVSAGFLWAGNAAAQTAKPDAARLIDKPFVAALREIVASDVIQMSVDAQNARFKGIDQAKIDALDKQWVAEREAADKPLIAMTLSNPVSTYLLRHQARSLGLYSEIFVIDAHGLNVGQSSITSDFWQGDEAKWQKTFAVGADAVFVDEPEWDAETKTWRVQVSLTIVSPAAAPIGSVTFEVNLTELQRRLAA